MPVVDEQSSCHVAPCSKRLTIPRLELQAATCTAKIYAILHEELGLLLRTESVLSMLLQIPLGGSTCPQMIIHQIY